MTFPSLLFKAPIVWFGAFFILTAATLDAQRVRYKPFQKSAGTVSMQKNTATGAFSIVGVRVDFQPDSNRFTSGTGKFNPDYLDRPEIIIDPLPHDAGYFQAHLEFVKHYFETVSNQSISIETHLLPGIITLSKKMEAYAPLENGADETFKLADLVAETWEQVGELGTTGLPDLDPERTAWVIFHAGAGRDIELLGTTLDKTPQDIPSLYFGENRLRELLSNRMPADGFAVGGSNRVRNTLIIPETQSRRGVNADDSEFVIQLGINGILSANFGSFLGLPDLFNTQNGQSGIGQFGLMDGAGFFALNGLFPPEPSAWEKLDRGWIAAQTFSGALPQNMSLHEMSDRVNGRPLKIPINPSEYFLIENRYRNPQPEGVTLTIRKPDGSRIEQTFSPAELHLDQMNTDSLAGRLEPGVVVAVSHYDRALPGGVDPGENGEIDASDRILNGGILIWHIDDIIIQANRAENSINNNPLRRGIDLEEADGAQDIGLPITGSFYTALASGSAFDFWWSGNDSRVILQNGTEISLYKNRFGRSTFPNTRSNSGAFPGFELRDFSANLPVGTFTLSGTSNPTVRAAGDVGSLSGEPYFVLFPHAGDTLAAIRNGNSVRFQPISAGVFDDGFSVHASVPNARFLFWNNSFFAGNRNGIRAFSMSDGMWTTVWEKPVQSDLPESAHPASPLVGYGSSVFYQGTTQSFSSADGTIQELYGNRVIGTGGAVFHTNYILSTAAGTTLTPFPFDGRIRIHTVQRGTESEYVISGPDLWFSASGKSVSKGAFLPLLPRQISASEAVFSATTSPFWSFSTDGATVNGWPAKSGTLQHAQQVLFKRSSNPFETLVFVVEADHLNTSLQAYSSDGKAIDSLRMSLASPQIWFEGIGEWLLILEQSGQMISWRIPGFEYAGSVETGTPGNGNLSRTILSSSATPPAFSGLLNRAETYNWPNPALDHTNIRFQTSDPGSVSITISHQDGSIRKKVTATTAGRAPEEVSISTQNWPSGVYFVLVKAEANGRSESKLIKMAVIR